MSIKEEIRDRFINCLTQLRLKQNEVCEIIPYNFGNLSSIVNKSKGRYMPEKALLKFCDYYNVNPDYIFKGIGKMKTNNFNNENIANEPETEYKPTKTEDMIEKLQLYKENNEFMKAEIQRLKEENNELKAQLSLKAKVS